MDKEITMGIISMAKVFSKPMYGIIAPGITIFALALFPFLPNYTDFLILMMVRFQVYLYLLEADSDKLPL